MTRLNPLPGLSEICSEGLDESKIYFRSVIYNVHYVLNATNPAMQEINSRNPGTLHSLQCFYIHNARC